MSHNKTWECSNPCGDGCDGKHEQTTDIREKARVIAWPHSNLIEPRAADALIDNIVHAIQDERDAAIGECAKACRDYAHSGNVSMMRRQVAYACEKRVLKLKGDAS